MRLGSVLAASCTPSASDTGGSGSVDWPQSAAGFCAAEGNGATIDGVDGAGTSEPFAAEHPATSNTTEGRIARPRTITTYPLKSRALVPTRSAAYVSNNTVRARP
ncbi:hypothetical protein GCM10010530_26370 [Kribbella aluminosa]